MKKFQITDEDGRTCTVEELEEVKKTEDADVSSSLTDDEISALKSLAASAPQILALLKVEEKEHEAMSDEDEDDRNPEEEEKDIDDAEEIEEEKEEIIDTDEDKDASMKDSVGSIDNTTVVNDSCDVQDDISSAWSKRYGGTK